jgi:hypothetical protein
VVAKGFTAYLGNDMEKDIIITPWTDETSIPDWVNDLLSIPQLPENLKNDLQRAIREVNELGAVNYPTKARIDYWLHQYHDF